jgi:hypothetical protein
MAKMSAAGGQPKPRRRPRAQFVRELTPCEGLQVRTRPVGTIGSRTAGTDLSVEQPIRVASAAVMPDLRVSARGVTRQCWGQMGHESCPMIVADPCQQSSVGLALVGHLDDPFRQHVISTHHRSSLLESSSWPSHWVRRTNRAVGRYPTWECRPRARRRVISEVIGLVRCRSGLSAGPGSRASVQMKRDPVGVGSTT